MTTMTLQALHDLVMDEAYASAFQSTGQYRGALLRHFDSLTAGANGELPPCPHCSQVWHMKDCPVASQPVAAPTDWKAAHADMVKRNALLREREDLPVDRIPAHAELVRLQEQNATLRAALANQPDQEQAEPTWGAVKTVGDMVRNLRTLDQAEPIFSAFHLDFNGARRCRTSPISISHERVIDGKWVDSTRKDVPYATVVWAKPDERAEQAPVAAAPDARPLAHGHREDFRLLANARRLGLEPMSRVRHMPNWVLATELFATGSSSAYQICRDAGIDPDGFKVQYAGQEDGS